MKGHGIVVAMKLDGLSMVICYLYYLDPRSYPCIFLPEKSEGIMDLLEGETAGNQPQVCARVCHLQSAARMRVCECEHGCVCVHVWSVGEWWLIREK